MRPLPGAIDARVGEKEVGEVVAVEQDVGGFDVAVQQTNLMGRMQCLSDLVDGAHRPRGIQRPVGQHGLQIATLDQPHIHIETAVDFAIVVNRNHMRGVQPRGHMGFTTEPLERLHLIGMLCEDVVEGDGL